MMRVAISGCSYQLGGMFLLRNGHPYLELESFTVLTVCTLDSFINHLFCGEMGVK